MPHYRKSRGFTIVELVIVILVLGLLSAVALPRFMDVSDEAHEAVFANVFGDMTTAEALFYGAWYIEGKKPGALVEGFGNGDLYAQNNNSGSPAGFTDATIDTNICLEIYQGLLQNGAPTAVTATGSLADDDERELVVETAAGANPDADIIAVFDITSGTFDGQTFSGCTYYYVDQYGSGTSTSPHTIPVMLFGTGAAGKLSALASFEFNDD